MHLNKYETLYDWNNKERYKMKYVSDNGDWYNIENKVIEVEMGGIDTEITARMVTERL